MSTLKSRFLLMREKRPDISNADLARLVGVKPPSVTDWFSGETKSLKAETAAALAAIYEVDATWLATGRGTMESSANAPATVESVQPTWRSQHTAVLGKESEKRLMRFLAVLYQMPEDRRSDALLIATEVLLDHLPPPPSA